MKIKTRGAERDAGAAVSGGRWNEIQAIVLFAAGILVLISLASFSFSDIRGFTSSPNVPPRNFAGIFGAYVGAALFFVMGMSSYVIPLLIFTWAAARLFGVTPQKLYFKISGTFFLILASSSLFSMLSRGDASHSFRFSLGGIVGLVFSDFLVTYLGRGGAILSIAVLFLLSLLTATEFLLLPFLSGIFRSVRDASGNMAPVRQKAGAPDIFTPRGTAQAPGQARPVIKLSTLQQKNGAAGTGRGAAVQEPPAVKEPPRPPIKIQRKEPPREAPDREAPASPAGAPGRAQPAPGHGAYRLPSLDLLDKPSADGRKVKEDFEATARILEDTLREFDIEGKVVEINEGPVITRYELEPAAGVKMHRITSLSDNLALSMKAQSVRIIAPVPGKGTVGFEIPNSHRAVVYLSEILDSDEYRRMKSKLKMALGKDVAGAPVVADLEKMPHLLIAGATGSGKTVCVNTIIASLLFNMSPDELKFIMVDPKRVELVSFNGMPHLLAPVVTDVKAVANTLGWVVNEMDTRFKMLAEAGVRNIESYNETSAGSAAKPDGALPDRMPYIIVVIDELADLMMVARDDVEHAITRLAQLARAVGIHLIIATQRPSVDVITGVIKANFPARISFKVASKVDSRTVLDANGADDLLGRGDMLFIEPGAADPVRAQGGLISDKEIAKLSDYIKAQRAPEYIPEISEIVKKGGFKKFEKDEVYGEAVKLVLETRQASVSVLQRRLGVGYTRAARLVDMMEDEGIVGPYQGSKPRDLLITLEEYQARTGGAVDAK
jgi:S-DNA-T family DNA segregation ATPase FtsK/SpoIIIE